MVGWAKLTPAAQEALTTAGMQGRLTAWRCGACKHRVTEQDVAHAFRNAVQFIPYEYDGEERLLVIGPARNGAMLELVAVPANDPDRIIHADDLRPSFYLW